MIEWSSALSVGIAVIDDQHCAFVGLLNRLYAMSHTDASREELRAMLTELVSYAEFHFVEEEAQMRLAGYPRLAEHRAKHDAAAAKIHDLLIHDADEVELYRFFSNFLRSWLVTHIMGDDKAFGEWLRANRSGSEG